MAEDGKELSQPDKGLITRGLRPLRNEGVDHPTPEKYWLRKNCLEWAVVKGDDKNQSQPQDQKQ